MYKGLTTRVTEVKLESSEEIHILEKEFRISTLHLFDIERVWVTSREHDLGLELFINKNDLDVLLQGIEIPYKEESNTQECDKYDIIYSYKADEEFWGSVTIFVKNINEEDFINVKIVRYSLRKRDETMNLINRSIRNKRSLFNFDFT
ncbi:hypothetical protein RBH29_15525 [Herbivorax sp. ANBcel31]|uniref:hypothetical protein n=1 Tax=Herbivorax sp. ANBcel31 TaxID=3069754 RepID=UPI0027B222E2|nr:hypothetical protein [Herbivorax sp. ANBcel31]MDQ2087841.1 hypothetical protein [Herbivorax sp. ANBcel31]